jgi:hypothetical protein
MFVSQASLFGLVLPNALAYLARTKVTNKMKCCEYGNWVRIRKTFLDMLLQKFLK